VASLAAYRERWTEEHAVAMLQRAARRLSREARGVAGDLAERAQEKRKSVRIFRKVRLVNLFFPIVGPGSQEKSFLRFRTE
jgi:hypothetical protein